MNPLTSSQIRSEASLSRFERLDRRLCAWAERHGAKEQRFPVLINADTLRRAEYPDAFPHLTMAAAVAANPNVEFADGNARLANWYLSPAVCYHAYAELAGQTLEHGQTISARGCCFRNEDPADLVPGRRQLEFEMRELILIGSQIWIDGRLKELQADVDVLAREFGFHDAKWEAANDPFFLPVAKGKAHLQRLLGTKIELCLSDGLAIASINRHGAFFGERFDIRTRDRSAAHSACVAFGLDRWAAHQKKL